MCYIHIFHTLYFKIGSDLLACEEEIVRKKKRYY